MREVDIVKKLREKLPPQAVVIKHADQSTHGIPDLAVTYGGRTTYIEVKLLETHETISGFRKKIDPLQLAFCHRLQHQGRCVYFIATKAKRAAIISPDSVANIRNNSKFFWRDVGLASREEGELTHMVGRLVDTCLANL